MAGASSQRRIELNRAAIDALTLGAADGLFEMACRVVEGAQVPDAPPLTQGLVEGGGAIAFVRGDRVAATMIGGRTIRVPRGARVRQRGAVAIGGFGFPGRLVEFGTARQAAQPFLTPSLLEQLPEAAPVVKAAALARADGKYRPGEVRELRQERKARQVARISAASRRTAAITGNRSGKGGPGSKR